MRGAATTPQAMLSRRFSPPLRPRHVQPARQQAAHLQGSARHHHLMLRADTRLHGGTAPVSGACLPSSQ